MNTPSTDISPGLGGFIAFFLLALALWLLMRSMNGKLRGISYRGEQEGAPRRRTQHEVTGSDAPERDSGAPLSPSPDGEPDDPSGPPTGTGDARGDGA